MERDFKRSVSGLEMVQKDSSSYDDGLPFDVVKLPSKGLLYPVEHPLHKKEVVEFKSMGAMQENILATPALLKQGTVLNVLIKESLIDRQIDPLSLLVGDKSAILLGIRVSGFGPEYTCDTKCPACAKPFKHEFNLKNATIKYLEASPCEEGRNLFEYILPIKKKKIKFSLATDGDDLEVLKIQDARKTKLKVPLPYDQSITDRLKLQIKEIDGKTDPEYIARFIDNSFPAKDSRALRAYINKIEPDMIMTETVRCPHCGDETSHPIPISTEFFWPQIED